jgi:hypothetical protein
MGLDQSLCQEGPPNLLDPFDINDTQLDYWRKDWDLQSYIGCENCEKFYLTEAYCNKLLADLPIIYPEPEDIYLLEHTKQAFTRALGLLRSGERIYYVPWW